MEALGAECIRTLEKSEKSTYAPLYKAQETGIEEKIRTVAREIYRADVRCDKTELIAVYW